MLRGRAQGKLVETPDQTSQEAKKTGSVGPKHKEQEQVYKSKPTEMLRGISSCNLTGFSQE